MIYVDRNRQEAGQVIRPSDTWFENSVERTQTAIEEGAEHEVTELYKHAQVKMALEKLFHDKCAYCECRPSAGNPWDVEHYRPKGRVAERPDHPGYYWLAYDWNNLLPSCSDCNRSRKDQPRFDEPVTLPAQGKLDQFPIENEEEDRAMAPDDDWTKERPYLLNPCCDEDKPEEHLTYDFFGRIHPIRDDDLRASETIRICNLKRRRLRDDRAREILKISKVICVRRALADAEDALAVGLIDDIIEGMVSAGVLYAAAVRTVRRKPDEFVTEPTQ